MTKRETRALTCEGVWNMQHGSENRLDLIYEMAQVTNIDIVRDPAKSLGTGPELRGMILRKNRENGRFERSVTRSQWVFLMTTPFAN